MKDIRTFSKKFSLPLFVFHLLDISTHCWPHTRNNAPMETPFAPLPATASIPFTLTPESWSEKEARLFPHDPDSEGISRTRPYSIDHANLEAVHLHLRTPSRRKCNIPRPRGSGIELVSIEPPASRRNAKEAWCVHSRTMERDSTRLRYPRIIFFLSFFLSLTLHFGEKDDSLFFVKLAHLMPGKPWHTPISRRKNKGWRGSIEYAFVNELFSFEEEEFSGNESCSRRFLNYYKISDLNISNSYMMKVS